MPLSFVCHCYTLDSEQPMLSGRALGAIGQKHSLLLYTLYFTIYCKSTIYNPYFVMCLSRLLRYVMLRYCMWNLTTLHTAVLSDICFVPLYHLLLRPEGPYLWESELCHRGRVHLSSHSCPGPGMGRPSPCPRAAGGHWRSRGSRGGASGRCGRGDTSLGFPRLGQSSSVAPQSLVLFCLWGLFCGCWGAPGGLGPHRQHCLMLLGSNHDLWSDLYL